MTMELIDSEIPYANLTPDVVIDSIEGVGVRCDGRILALNSYENRVYQIGLEDGNFLVAKFYRFGRWSDAAIKEEHSFSSELADQGIPVLAPLEVSRETLHENEGYRFTIFPRQGGRWPELGTANERMWLGRSLGRIHAIGATQKFKERGVLSVEQMGQESVRYLLDSNWVPAHLLEGYRVLTEQLLLSIAERFAELEDYPVLRIHGDCHRGNVLWTDGPYFVDFDDCINGPAVQDLWLFLAGEKDAMSVQLGDLLEGYGQFCDFDYRQLRLIEPLRTLRIIHYAAWIARRWKDPAFPRAFPWFTENKFWEEHVLTLKEQVAAIHDSPLAIVV